MLDCGFKGSLFESLNSIIKIAEEIEKQDIPDDKEATPFGVEICDDCGEIMDDCTCLEDDDYSDNGSAGYQPDENGAILGCDKSEQVGDVNPKIMIEESIVDDVKAAVSKNIDASKKHNVDPFGYFKNALKIDLTEPVVKTGEDLIK